MRYLQWKYKYLTVILLLHLVLSYAGAQSNLPEKPVLNFVSVDTMDQGVIIDWNPSTSSGILYYKIYSLDISTTPVTGTYIDSVLAGVLTYKHFPNSPEPLIYTVTAVDAIGESLLSGDYHRAAKVYASYDSCNHEMNLEWDHYLGWYLNLAGYKIYCSENSGDFEEIEVLLPKYNSFTHEGVKENIDYRYVVLSFDNAGTTSFSNIRTYYTFMPSPPSFINLDYVSVTDDKTVEISFSTELEGEINDFQLLRAESSEAAFIDWMTIMDVDHSPFVLNDNLATRGKQVIYQINALNSCLNPISSSNVGTNILLRGEVEGTLAKIYWNEYKSFEGELEEYNIYRMNSTDEFELIQTSGAEVNSYMEDLSMIGQGKMKGEISYQVIAVESDNNPYGIKGLSRSNELRLNIETQLFVPNAFTPNNDGMNDIFGPVLDFIPSEYMMLIFDRTGKKLFQTEDPYDGWDGTLDGSTPARQGVYIYHIEYKSYSGVRKVLTGNLSLVNP